MSKKKPCGLDYCPQEEIIGAYASCSACAWGNDSDDESEEDKLREQCRAFIDIVNATKGADDE